MSKTTNGKAKRQLRVQRVVRAQPDRDFEALKACCKALESCSCPRMVKATMDFLNSKYAPPGVLYVKLCGGGTQDYEKH